MDTPDPGEFFIHQHDGQRGILRFDENFYIIRYIVINQRERGSTRSPYSFFNSAASASNADVSFPVG